MRLADKFRNSLFVIQYLILFRTRLNAVAPFELKEKRNRENKLNLNCFTAEFAETAEKEAFLISLITAISAFSVVKLFMKEPYYVY